MFLSISRRSKFLKNNIATVSRFCSSNSSQSGPVSSDPLEPISLPANSCVIRGFHHDILLHKDSFEPLSEYADKNPLLLPIPKGRLIAVGPHRQLQLNDRWRHLLWSGFIHSMICKQKGETITDAFAFENLGVIKDLNILAFKEFTRGQDAEDTQNDHTEYAAFVKKLFSKSHGPTALQQLPDWANFLNSVLTTKPDDQLLHSSVFFGDEEMASLYIDLHRLVRHEFKNRGLGAEGTKILQEMEKAYTDAMVVTECRKNPLLAHLLGQHGSAKAKNAPPGSALVDVHRIAVSHAIEKELLTKVQTSSPTVDPKLLQTYDRKEVVRSLKYLFPDYPQAALNSFWDQRVWAKLDMDRRHPVPSIYSLWSPDIEETRNQE